MTGRPPACLLVVPLGRCAMPGGFAEAPRVVRAALHVLPVLGFQPRGCVGVRERIANHHIPDIESVGFRLPLDEHLSASVRRRQTGHASLSPKP